MEDANYRYRKTPVYSWWVLAMSVLCFMCSFLTLNNVAVFGTVIQEEWGINAAELSFLTTASMIPFCVFPVISSNFCDRCGVKTLVIIGLSSNIIGVVLMGFWGTSYASVIVFRVLQGMTGGIMNNSMAQHASLYFPTRMRGLATGILMGFLGIGFSLVSILGAWLYEGIGMTWQLASMWIGAVPSAVMMILYVVTVKDFKKVYPEADSMDDLLPPDPKVIKTKYDDLPKPASMSEVVKDKRCIASAFLGFTTAIPVYGLAYVLPLFLQEQYGMTLVAASSVIAATFVFKLVAAPVGGMISDNIFKGMRWQTNFIGMLLGGLLIFLLAFLNIGGTFLPIYLIIMYLGVSLYGGTYWTWPTRLAKPSAQYATSGFIVSISNIGAVVAAPFAGLLITATGTTSSGIIMIGIIGSCGAIFSYFQNFSNADFDSVNLYRLRSL